jgi:hypothetical protein
MARQDKLTKLQTISIVKSAKSVWKKKLSVETSKHITKYSIWMTQLLNRFNKLASPSQV